MPGLLDHRPPRDGDGDGFYNDSTRPTPVGPARPAPYAPAAAGLPGEPEAAHDAPPPMREFGDQAAVRSRIYGNVLKAATTWKPIQNQRHTLALENIAYEDPAEHTLAAQKAAILRGDTLARRLRGDWVLRDNETGKEVDRKRSTLAAVPYVTDRGTFIQGGSEYTLCFHRSVQIWTEDGMVPIGQLVDERRRVRVWSYDFATAQFVLKPITGWFRNRTPGGLGRAVFDAPGRFPVTATGFTPTTLWATPDHEVYTLEGGKTPLAAAEQLVVAEEILTETQRQLVYGTLLGDGVMGADGIYRVGHGIDQADYVHYKWELLGNLAYVEPYTAQHITRGRPQQSVRFWSRATAEFRRIYALCYPGGQKQVSQIWLDRVGAAGLAFWFMDDGSATYTRTTNHADLSFHTQGFNAASITLLRQWLSARWGLHTYTDRDKGVFGDRDMGWIIKLTGDNAQRFLDIVAPYVVDCLRYKLLRRPRPGACRQCARPILRTRRTCNRCFVAEIVSGGLRRGNYRKSSQRRFGDRQAIARAFSGDVPVDPTGCERWDARDLRVGSAIPAMLQDTATRYCLTTTPCRFVRGTGARWEATRHAYDIRVADTHNYFANGVLVSNCSQLRLRPGVYARVKDNGELEAHVNVAGLGQRVALEPETGVFHLQVGQSRVPLVSLLKGLGVTDRQVMSRWGNELGSANLRKDDPGVVDKLFARFSRGEPAEGETKGQALARIFAGMALDPNVTRRTLGKPYDHVSADVLMDAADKLVAINKGEAEPDDRDHLAYMSVHGPEDLIAERLGRDRLGLRKVLWRASMAGSLRSVPTGVFTKSIQAAITGSGLGQPSESINPLMIFDQQGRVSRMGEGGIPSLDSVPTESRSVQPSHLAYIDPLVTPESLRVGVDSRVARVARKGDDGRLYAPFRDARTGQPVWRSTQQVADAVIAFPGELESGRPHVAAMENSRTKVVPRSRVQYQLPHMEDAFSATTNLVPMKSAVKGQRAVMAGRMLTQALPVENAEAPFVQSGVPGSQDDSFENLLGRHMGALRSPVGGVVESVSPDAIVVRDANTGKKTTHELYNNLPFNRKTFGHQTPVVRPGDRVEAGGLLAKSNYTDAAGVTALGLNARVAYLPFKGQNFEDAIVVSEAFAKRMCFDQATELLTSRGWLSRSALRADDHVACLDGGRLVYEPVLAIHDYETTELVAAASKQFDIAVTPEHSLYLSKARDNNYRRIEARQAVGKCLRLLRTATNTNADQDFFALPSIVKRGTLGTGPYGRRPDRVVPPLRLPMDDWCLLFGLYIAEGHCDDPAKTSSPNVIITQCKARVREVLAALSARLGFGFLDAYNRWLWGSKQAATYLRPLGKAKAKRLPDWVWTLSERQARILLRGLMLGDGHKQLESKGHGNYFTSSPGLADDVQRLALHCGYSANVALRRPPASPPKYKGREIRAKSPAYRVSVLNVGNRPHLNHARTKLVVRALDAPVSVWCVTTRTGVVYVRRNGKPRWCGNSSQHMYQHALDLDAGVRAGRGVHASLFPGKYDRATLANFDDDGVIKPGTVVDADSPLVLAVKKKDVGHNSLHRGRQALYDDASVTWEHHTPGVVTDVAKTARGIVVAVKTTAAMEVGDKMSGRYGDKGVISAIVPDHEMPHDKDGKPYEVLLNPLGIISRCYDEATEFLVRRRGWVRGDDVRIADQLLGFTTEPTTPLAGGWADWDWQVAPFHVAEYRGPMYRYADEQVDLLVTPGHTFWAAPVKELPAAVGQPHPGPPEFRVCHVEDLRDGRSWWVPVPHAGRTRRQVSSAVACDTDLHALRPEGWSVVDYAGRVFCPTVESGFVFTRRNGKVVVAGNTNPAQMHEAALGKVVEKTGRPAYRVQDFQNQDLNQFAMDELRKHGLSDLEDVVDPVRGAKIRGVFTGNRFFMKLHHTAESKGKGRGTAAYTMEGRPAQGGATGSKRISLMDVNAILSHGATEVLRDAGAIRGQQHPELWQQFMSGHAMPNPEVPLVHRKFVDSLKAAGINVVREGTRLNVMALTDRDVAELAGDREVQNAETVHWGEGLRPVAGGLFDPNLTGGHNGNRWAAMKLAEPMPNPVMEEPTRRLLNLTTAQFRDVLAGRAQLRGRTGPGAIHAALDRLKVPEEIDRARQEIRSGRKGARDAAVRRLGYLKGCEKTGVHPRDWTLSRVPVLPPAFRPVATMGGKGLPLVADPNYLYRELHDANKNLGEMRDLVGDVGDERLAVYDAFKAVAGLGDPLQPKNQEKQVKGLLKHVFGAGGPKTGVVQRKLLGTPTDLVGLATITPNPDLDMDQVGIPEAKAWDVYRPFIVRRLVRRGMKRLDAAKAAADRTNVARKALLDEMGERPVILSRAPVLHRYGVMAFKPVLTQGNTLQVPPLVVSGFGADFDGDTQQYHVPASDEAVRDAYEKMLPSRNLLAVSNFRAHQLPSKEFAGGLFAATTATNAKARPRVYRNADDVLRAYRNGEIDADHPIHVLEA